MLQQRLLRIWGGAMKRQHADFSSSFEPNEGVAAGGNRLESVAETISHVANELERTASLREALMRAGGNIQQEFRSRVKENARIAALQVELTTTLGSLRTLEADTSRIKAEFKTATQENIKLTAQLSETGAKLENAERDQLELRQAVAEQKLAYGKLEEELRKSVDASSDVALALRATQADLELQSKVAFEVGAIAKALKEENLEANDRLATLAKHLDESRTEAAAASLQADDLRNALDAAHDQVHGLENKLANAEARIEQLVQDRHAQAALTKTRNSEIELKLDEAASRIARLEAGRAASLAELAEANAERTELRREVAAKEIAVHQLSAKLASTEAALESQRAKTIDTEQARSAAILRAENLNKDLIAVLGRCSRAEAALDQHAKELKSSVAAEEEIRAGLTQKNKELQTLVAQQKSEIAMLRGAIDAIKKFRPVPAEGLTNADPAPAVAMVD